MSGPRNQNSCQRGGNKTYRQQASREVKSGQFQPGPPNNPDPNIHAYNAVGVVEATADVLSSSGPESDRGKRCQEVLEDLAS